MSKLFLEISGPRLGSTSFRYKLAALGPFLPIGELFNRSRTGTPQRFRRVLDEHEEDGLAVSPDLRSMYESSLTDPVKSLEYALSVADTNGKEYAVVKLAPGHLKSHQIARVIQRFRPAGVILHRAPIDQFISRMKARELRSWRNVDTTGIKPDIDADSFRRWRRRQQNHLQMGRHLLARYGCSFVTIGYEEMSEADNPLVFLESRLAEIGIACEPQTAPYKDLKRQDRSTSRTDKVGNWNEFHSRLSRANALNELEQFDLVGNGAALNVQISLERCMPNSIVSWVARQSGHAGHDKEPRRRA